MMKTIFLTCALLLTSAIFAEQNSLNRLMQGNQRFVQGRLEHPSRGQEARKAVAASQEPFAIVVACSDSRVAPEILFDQGLGDLFVVRVAGNVIGPLELDSIEFSAIHLHSSVILVLGHENCGAVKAVIAGTTKEIEAVAELIDPSVREARKQNPQNLLSASIKANALRMKEDLLKTPSIQKLVAEKKLEVHAGYYNLKTGVVEILEKNGEDRASNARQQSAAG